MSISPGTRTKRLAKEIKSLSTDPPCGVAFPDQDLGDFSKLKVDLLGAEGTLYDKERFQLQFDFPSSYPLDPPEVIFVHPEIPIHPHIYSNGHICLSILYDQWSPALGIQSVCLSILSMLSSADQKVRPPDDQKYLRQSVGKGPKSTQWNFHDDCWALYLSSSLVEVIIRSSWPSLDSSLDSSLLVFPSSLPEATLSFCSPLSSSAIASDGSSTMICGDWHLAHFFLAMAQGLHKVWYGDRIAFCWQPVL